MFQWLGQLQGAQASFIGAVVGFVFGIPALIFGALFNAHLNRGRDDRLRAEETKAVAAALYSEMLILREQAAYVARITAATYMDEGTSRRPTRRFDEVFLEQNVLAVPMVFPALVNKLGLLPPGLVLDVTRFYGWAEEIRFWLPKLMPSEKRPFSYSVLQVLHPARSMVVDIIPTLTKLERLLRITAPSKQPELGANVDVAIVQEEDIFSSPS